MELEKLTDDELELIAGGSIKVREEPAKKAGIYLLKSDGTPGEWGNLWNNGDYYWRGEKIEYYQANRIIEFYKKHGRQPYNLKESEDYYNSQQQKLYHRRW